jgi:hypothetical protein
MLKTISKELIRFAIFSIIFIGVGSTIASQAPTNNQNPTDETGQPTELASDFSTGDIISANTLNNMKIHWDNIIGKQPTTWNEIQEKPTIEQIKCYSMSGVDSENYLVGGSEEASANIVECNRISHAACNTIPNCTVGSTSNTVPQTNYYDQCIWTCRPTN